MHWSCQKSQSRKKIDSDTFAASQSEGLFFANNHPSSKVLTMCNNARHFWKCPLCLTVAATEGSNVGSLSCGYCKVAMSYMGRVSQNRLVRTEERCKCDARCTFATGPNCDCQCGGVNHGSKVLVEVTIDCGAVPTANVKPTAQALWDLKEYQTLRATLQNELTTLNLHPSLNYNRCQRITGALWKAATMTSHAGRMKHLRSVAKTDSKPQQASLFQ